MDADVTGAGALIAWFGGWPSFHDAEVLELHLRRTGPSHLRIHTWKMTDQVDAAGYYVLEKHVVVTLTLSGIRGLSLEGFSGQNVLSGLGVDKAGELISVTLEPCYGLYGYLTAERVGISFVPGEPVEEVAL